MLKRVVVLAVGVSATAGVGAALPVLMSGEWGVQACEAWNAEPILTGELMESGWVDNDAGRGYKILQVYRNDCGEAPTAELRVSAQDGAARCVYGGGIETTNLEPKVDYVMHATTERWQQMGAGEYGPMKAMMLRRLRFAGPKWEAMKNMGPFKAFLLLAGKVPSDTSSCP